MLPEVGTFRICTPTFAVDLPPLSQILRDVVVYDRTVPLLVRAPRRVAAGRVVASATFNLVATAAGKSASASVQVTSPADYDALLAQSGLDSNGEIDAPSVAVIATSTIGGGDAKSQDKARKRRLIFIGVIAVAFEGLNLWQAATAILLGTGLGSLFHAVLSSWGPKFGVPMMIVSRGPFGFLGNILPASPGIP